MTYGKFAWDFCAGLRYALDYNDSDTKRKKNKSPRPFSPLSLFSQSISWFTGASGVWFDLSICYLSCSLSRCLCRCLSRCSERYGTNSNRSHNVQLNHEEEERHSQHMSPCGRIWDIGHISRRRHRRREEGQKRMRGASCRLSIERYLGWKERVTSRSRRKRTRRSRLYQGWVATETRGLEQVRTKGPNIGSSY